METWYKDRDGDVVEEEGGCCGGSVEDQLKSRGEELKPRLQHDLNVRDSCASIWDRPETNPRAEPGNRFWEVGMDMEEEARQMSRRQRKRKRPRITRNFGILHASSSETSMK